MFGAQMAARQYRRGEEPERYGIVQITHTRVVTALLNPWTGSQSILEATCIDETEEVHHLVKSPYITACDSIVETILNPELTNENFRICQEMYSTERNYIDNLKLLLKVRDALLERVAKNKPVMEEATIKQIFGKVKPIVDLHEKIIIELEDLIDNFEEKGRNIAEIWKNASYELLRIYPSYTNYCDTARSIFITACERSPKLKVFIENLEKDPSFRRMRTIDIMAMPVQRLAGVKLLLEKLQRKSGRGQRALIQGAIDKVGDVLSQSNTIRLNNDKYMASLSLLSQVDSIPVKLVKSSNDMISSVDGRFICATDKLGLKESSKIRLVLFKDATVLVCKKSRSFGEKTWIGKAVWTKTFMKTFKKPYKYIMTLSAEQFRGITFIFCPRIEKIGGKAQPLQRTSLTCWKIRENRSDIEWFVDVNVDQMRMFTDNLVAMLSSRVNNIETRGLGFDRMMYFADVPVECQAPVKKELTEKGFDTTEQNGRLPVLASMKSMAHKLGWGTVGEVFQNRTVVVKQAKLYNFPRETPETLDSPQPIGRLRSPGHRPQLEYPIEVEEA